MYHHILKDQSRLNKYTISPDEFRRDMQYLQDNGYTPVLMQDLLLFVQEGVPLPDKPVTEPLNQLFQHLCLIRKALACRCGLLGGRRVGLYDTGNLVDYRRACSGRHQCLGPAGGD